MDLRYKALRQSVYRVALTVADDVTVDPEGYTDVAMAELISNQSDRGLEEIRAISSNRLAGLLHFPRGFETWRLLQSLNIQQ